MNFNDAQEAFNIGVDYVICVDLDDGACARCFNCDDASSFYDLPFIKSVELKISIKE
jgi:hypothetical protein